MLGNGNFEPTIPMRGATEVDTSSGKLVRHPINVHNDTEYRAEDDDDMMKGLDIVEPLP